MLEEDLKAPEAPELKKPEAPVESLIENRREKIEAEVIAENESFPELENNSEDPAEKPGTPEENKDQKTVDPSERIREGMQKRINKLTAKTKTAEERLAEAESEIARLKAKPEVPEKAPENNEEISVEQIEAYIIKQAEIGNWAEHAKANRFLIKFEKDKALKEIEAKQNETRKNTESEKARQLNDWIDLQRDYVVLNEKGEIDAKNDLTISNQTGLLYKTALSLFNDPQLHKDFYNDPNPIMGLRRAAADAFREIHQQGLVKNPKGASEPKRNLRESLADPSTDFGEAPTGTSSAILSDAEKVRDEIKARKANRFARKPPQN